MIRTDYLPKLYRNKVNSGKIERICRDNDVSFMALFGSFAGGRQTPKSDIDFLIRFDNPQNKSLLDLIHTENELKKVFRRKVDLVTSEGISPYLKQHIMKTLKVIYEAG